MKKRYAVKVFLLLLFLMVIPLAIALLILWQNQDADLKKGSVTGVSIYVDGRETILEDKKEIEFFISLATSGDSIESAVDDLSSYRMCEIVFHKPKNDLTYHFYLSDSVNNCLYTTPTGELFLLREKEATQILSHRVIYSFAISFAERPTLTLKQGGVSFDPSLVSGEWTLKKTDGSFQTGSVREEKKSVVILPAREAFCPVFSIEPSSCAFVLTGAGLKTVSGPLSELKTPELDRDTHLTLVLTCTWAEGQSEDYHGNLEYTFDIFYDVPTEYQLDKESVAKGGFFTIRVMHTTSEQVAVTPTFFAGQIQTQKSEDGYLITVSVPESVLPGQYSILLMGSDIEKSLTVNITE